MKLQFDPSQQFQLDAVRAVVALFNGQPDGGQLAVSWEDSSAASLRLTETGIANQLAISREQWLENLQSVQQHNGLAASQELARLHLDNGDCLGDFPNFTVEMETGTGKTYVYLRTIQALAKTYGLRKFVIVVPSVAIREGVLKSLHITREHLQTLYGHERCEFMVYDAGRVNQLRNFALSDAIQILVMNIDAFAKDYIGGAGKKGNVINQLRETGIRPIEFIQACNPIVIIDEPQNLETDLRKQAIARLNPLCTLRYSATHRDTYNLIYSLDPVRAYELGLVKQISVDSVLEERDANQAFVAITGFSSGKRSISAKLSIWVNQASGPAKKMVTAKNGDDLFILSKGREIYRNGFIVNAIDAGEGYVAFANDVRVYQGQPQGALNDDILRLQIEATVLRHFEKARKLHPLGIKVLSVFFIDRVANYRQYQDDGTAVGGKFARWFEDIFQQFQAKPEFAGLLPQEADKAHNGYFSQDRQAVSPFATLTGKTKGEAEASAFELIMRDKERLLDLAEPLAFIFSHSALREGWDNPNVFQICTLAESSSDVKKRQEIGRGLRLCVNQDGARVLDKAINRLTVIANESYEDFAAQLQAEMVEAGVSFKREMVHNEREKVEIRLRKGYQTDEHFLALWQKIRAKTVYRVHYHTATLIENAATTIAQQLPPIQRPKAELRRAELRIDRDGITTQETGYRTRDVVVRYQMPDFISQLQGKTGLAKSTVAAILLRANRFADALNNPQVFIDLAATLIERAKKQLLVFGDGSAESGVRYLKLANSHYEMRLFENDDLRTVFASNLVAVKNTDKTLFSHIEIDGNSTPERRFAEACESNEDVLFYLKLPRWFVIDTPVGSYNPDWALMYQNDEKLYFVAETKGTSKDGELKAELLRPIEEYKIECGKRHFRQFDGVQFKAVTGLEQLLR